MSRAASPAKRVAMLARIRAALGGGEVSGAPAAPQGRICVPARALKSKTERIADFKMRLLEQKVVVEDVAAPEFVPASVINILEVARMAPRIRCGAEPFYEKMPWPAKASLERTLGAASPTTAAALSHAIAGFAETGTLVLASGEENPVTLTFLPDLHIVTVEESMIVGGLEDAFDMVRARYGRGRMPRTLNLVSGASRTGDIGGQLVMGAHGPRKLAVLVVKGKHGGVL